MACRHLDGHRAGLDRFLYLGRGGHREADCLEADRRVRRRGPHVAHHRAHRHYAQGEVDDLRAAAVLAPADAGPADGPPASEPTA